MMLSRSILVFLSLAVAVSASAIPRADGACTDPAVRKEWRELTDPEKAEYIRAAVCLRKLPKTKYAQINAVTTRLDDLVYTHFTLRSIIHFVANFLPWHRYLLKVHEDLLRNECGYTGAQPYWDWTIDADAQNMPGSPIFDPVTGFGGDGQYTGSTQPGFQRCVIDGPFANTNLTLAMGWPETNVRGDRPHCLTRVFNSGQGNDANGNPIVGDMQLRAYNTQVMNAIYAFDNFADMATILEELPHSMIHRVISGDMGPTTAPNEPLFFLHHANVDRVWAKWQGRNDTRLNDYTGFQDTGRTIPASITDTMPVLELSDTPPTVKDYMNTQAGPLCYTYSSM
ncbi:Putative tyrosinase copper-binding domain, di-copper centre-containing domain superfamily [Colletotrichum destructivum]|uniref:Tyrosinase copper-binding domain, di-copper centre-containing domain superfamily n=1 Tax=Colletotrichum destructivum TaxID=34406 RepID=A0AAX4IV46_9PEZI|nr:Putative tyrosinase copper-binding domain, di-copper centre-containing domain superfamily [Colletotrichum destructivum]